METHLLLLRSGPGRRESESPLDLVAVMQGQGHRVALVLSQDAVLTGLTESRLPSAQRLRTLIEAGAPCYYLAEDLAMRGYGPGDVVTGCEAVTYGELVEVLFADGVRVSGAF